MNDDLHAIERGFTAHEQEHDRDPWDDAESFTVLVSERVAEKVARLCPGCGEPEPCACTPISAKEHEAMRRRYFGSKQWQS